MRRLQSRRSGSLGPGSHGPPPSLLPGQAEGQLALDLSSSLPLWAAGMAFFQGPITTCKPQEVGSAFHGPIRGGQDGQPGSCLPEAPGIDEGPANLPRLAGQAGGQMRVIATSQRPISPPPSPTTDV